MRDQVDYIASVVIELEQLISLWLLSKLHSTVRAKGNNLYDFLDASCQVTTKKKGPDSNIVKGKTYQ